MQVIVFQQSTLLPCPFKHPALPLLSLPLVERIAAGSRSFSRRPPRLHSITAVAAVAESKARSNLLSETEKRWQNVMDNPMEGVAFTLQEFEEALSKYDFSFEIGDTVKGVVFMTDSNGALVDIGAKAPAYLPVYEASMHRVKHVCEIGLQQGIEEEFQILREDDDNARLILSLRKLQFSVAWERCRQLQADDVTVKGKIISANKGGVVVSVEGLRGFVPFSQMFSRTNAEDLIDKSIPLKFLDVDEEQGRLILSNRRALMDGQALMDIGSVVEGIVQAVKPYGAFVNIGGISGLLHISQISNERIANVENVLSVGDKIKVMILSQDRERGRVSLSTKKLEPTPGDMLRNPALVYEKAEEMGQTFRERVAQAEAIARAEELRLQESGFGLVPDSTEANGAVNLQEQESSFLFNF